LRVVFDSSVLIAAFVEAHPKHDIALSWVKRGKQKEIGLHRGGSFNIRSL